MEVALSVAAAVIVNEVTAPATFTVAIWVSSGIPVPTTSWPTTIEEFEGQVMVVVPFLTQEATEILPAINVNWSNEQSPVSLILEPASKTAATLKSNHLKLIQLVSPALSNVKSVVVIFAGLNWLYD